MNALCVLYDETCGFCCACAAWLVEQRQVVPIHTLPAGSAEARAAFGNVRRHGLKSELVVIDSDGGVYRDADAWVVTLWALEEFRGWAGRLASPTLKPFARSLFELVSSNRHAVSKVLALQPDDVVQRRLHAEYGAPTEPKCTSEACVVSE